MNGAITGDIIGSRFERSNHKSTDFELFVRKCRFTDDTVLTLAIADALINQNRYSDTVKRYARAFPLAGYGGTFKKWMLGMIEGPYNSWGNGSAMRVSPIGWWFDKLEIVLREAEASAAITHNHPEGIKGAQAIASAIWHARKGATKEEIKAYIEDTFSYDLDRKIDDIRPTYVFDVSCAGSVPEAIIAFLESENFEDCIRLAVSIGGDSDTIAAMAGSVAEAYYGEVPSQFLNMAVAYLTDDLESLRQEFYKRLSKRAV
ncbi:MAG: ADP-ribosylglycohydrolase family protein [Bacteroidota bacterium]